ncbi:MAG: ABC transporter transmembrane domain-containing protein [Acidobacteriota bacterium]|nr:ABC transporter transmembrane domain-containing protein [Acidobacteriota bacterium]
MTTSSFLWGYFRRYSAWGGVAAVAILVYAMSFAAAVSLLEPMFGDVLQRPEDTPSIAANEDSSDSRSVANLKRLLRDGYESLERRFEIDSETVVYFVPILFVIVLLIRSLASFVSGYAFQRIGLGMTTDMRNHLFRRIVGQSSRFHARHSSAELISRVVNDVSVMQNAVSTRILDLFRESVTLFFLVYMLLSTDLRLALICLVTTPLFLYALFRFGKGMRSTSQRSQERMADLTMLLSEATRGHQVVQAFDMEDFEYQRFKLATRRHLSVRLRAQVLSHASGPVVEALAAIGLAAFLIYAGRAIRTGAIDPATMVAFMFNLVVLYDPVRKLNKVNLIVQEALAAVRRVRDLIREPNAIAQAVGARRHEALTEGVAFEGVTFAYRDQAVLSEVDLRIPLGETVALVGPSGAGKSTLVNLLPRFFDPDSGCVTVDGIDIRELTLKSLRGLVGIVTQDTVLFDDSVRNNIAYGRSDLPLETVRKAASAAYADDFIMELPEGYDTRIGEGGSQLSGGQRQRMSIARALLKNAPILILDEATSHLDTESELLVQKALSNLMAGRTTLVIAHRLSTVVSADRIVVMEGGRISEIGTHRELLERGGTYRRFYDIQFDI